MFAFNEAIPSLVYRGLDRKEKNELGIQVFKLQPKFVRAALSHCPS